MNEQWLVLTSTAYMLAEKRGDQILKYRYVDEIARNLLENLPTTAHLYALERIHTVGELQPNMWRQVLAELDKLEALNERSKVGGGVDGHISRREGEPHEAQQEPSVSDARDTWKPSAPSGVDESAL